MKLWNYTTVADLHRQISDTHPPPLTSTGFRAISIKNLSNNRLALPYPFGVGAPLGNHESVTANKLKKNYFPLVTVHNKVAKVMFLHLSVILFPGGVCLSAYWDTTPLPPQSRPPRADTPLEQTHPPLEQALPQSRYPPGAGTPGTRHPPGPGSPSPSRRLLLRTISILLKGILVYNVFTSPEVVVLKVHTGCGPKRLGKTNYKIRGLKTSH